MKKLNTVLKEVAQEGKVKFPVIQNKEFMEMHIDEMDLDQRSINVLKRSGVFTIKDIIKNLNLIQNVKGCGNKTVSRIMYKICSCYYSELTETEKNKYLMEIIKLNI